MGKVEPSLSAVSEVRCQAMRGGSTSFPQMGVHNNAYRCHNKPDWIVTQIIDDDEPLPAGRMSLCGQCANQLFEELGPDAYTQEQIIPKG